MRFSDLERYAYQLPEALIRRTPVEPRDSAGLFVYDTQTDTITLDRFCHVAEYLPPDSLMILNDTRVLPARLWLTKETGGKIEVLALVNEWDGQGLIPALIDRKLAVGDMLTFPDGSKLVVESHVERRFFFRLDSQRPLFELLTAFGTTPIPHYLETAAPSDEGLLRKRYQTIFAAAGASVAAPTASLHFTDSVFECLEQRRIEMARVTLNVGLGTFAPLREEHFISGKLHSEYVTVTDEAARQLRLARTKSRPMIAVGTTVARALETLALLGDMRAMTATADLFISPPYPFQMVDILMTNFHLPRTSLMLLVDAFLQYKGAQRGVVELYQEAIEKQFSFYSFGDSMLII